MAKFWVEEDSNWIYSQITDETEYELTKVGDTKVVKMFCNVCVHCGQPIINTRQSLPRAHGRRFHQKCFGTPFIEVDNDYVEIDVIVKCVEFKE